MNKRVLYIVFLALTLFACSKLKGQIVIQNVTVINDQGHVRINWDYNGAENLLIQRDSIEINGLHTIATVSAASGEYIDTNAEANKKPRIYWIVSSVDPSNIASETVSTIHMTSSYDSCASEMTIEWIDLVHPGYFRNEWEALGYTLHANIDGTPISRYLDNYEEEYTFTNIPQNTTNTFYVETLWVGQDSSSNSNANEKYTEMPVNPSYINAVSSSVVGSSINLKFEVDPNSETDTYKLFKSNAYFGSYSLLESITTNDYTINVIDDNANPDNEINYYKLSSIDICNHETTESDISNNILLEIENNEFVNTLSWNFFKEESFIVTDYEIYRISSSNTPELIRSLENYDWYSDNLEKLQGEQLTGQFCYYIRAITEDNLDEYSQSNTVCTYLNPKVYIPEAFTPNDDGINDIFNAVFSFLPENFEMKIYGRWGSVVYETKDAEKGWNGRQSNGSPASTGTYIYYIKYKNPGNKTIEKRGNVTVIYP